MSEEPDYKQLIDDEVWAFIEKTEQSYPEDTVSKPVAEQRELYNAMCKSFASERPIGVTVVDDLVESAECHIPVRRYLQTESLPSVLIIYMHGGGFVVGDLDSHDSVCAELCDATGFSVTAIDYRLAPEHKHPAAFNDCLAVTLSEAARVAGASILLCGDSAGGNLCAAVSHALRAIPNAPKIDGQVLLYPALGGDMNQGSYLQHANAPLLSLDEIKQYISARFDGAEPSGDSTAAPLHDTDFANLPPTVVFSAQCDPLCDDGKQYCKAIEKAGGEALSIMDSGLVHGHIRARHISTRAAESFSAVIDALDNLAQTPDKTI